MARQINDAGLQLIASSEGLRLSAYQDVAGIWTIGYGHISLLSLYAIALVKLFGAVIRRFGAKPDKKLVDRQAAMPSSWKTP